MTDPSNSLGDPLIFIVDHDTDLSSLIHAWLEMRGARAVEYSSWTEFRQACSISIPDATLIDSDLLGSSAELRVSRLLEITKRDATILMSAHPLLAIAEGIPSGFLVLQKPFAAEALMVVVAIALQS